MATPRVTSVPRAKLVPFGHQESGAAFLAARKAAGLFDDPGLGKTGTALLAAQRADARTILIVCPVVVLRNWEREVQLWIGPRRVQILRRSEHHIQPGVEVVIVPYSLIANPKLRRTLMARRWDVCIVDEAHYLKTPTAQRTVSMYGLGRSEGIVSVCDRVWLLTGTPMPNNPTELWAHLRALAPERTVQDGAALGARAWRDRYCTLSPSSYTPDGWRVTGSKNMDELRRRMVGFSIRRRKGDHLDLPPLRWGQVALDVIELPKELRDIEADLPDDPKAAVEALRESSQFSTWRRLCGLAKAGAAVDLIAAELAENDEQVVVFVHHREVAEAVAAGLRAAKLSVVEILGSTPLDERQAAVDAFQTKQARVALCNIVAGGVGVTLTAASNVVFIESSWVPGEMQQAADRCHRIGQTAPVLARVCTLAGSIDELIAATLETKRAMIRALENGEN